MREHFENVLSAYSIFFLTACILVTCCKQQTSSNPSPMEDPLSPYNRQILAKHVFFQPVENLDATSLIKLYSDQQGLLVIGTGKDILKITSLFPKKSGDFVYTTEAVSLSSEENKDRLIVLSKNSSLKLAEDSDYIAIGVIAATLGVSAIALRYLFKSPKSNQKNPMTVDNRSISEITDPLIDYTAPNRNLPVTHDHVLSTMSLFERKKLLISIGYNEADAQSIAQAMGKSNSLVSAPPRIIPNPDLPQIKKTDFQKIDPLHFQEYLRDVDIRTRVAILEAQGYSKENSQLMARSIGEARHPVVKTKVSQIRINKRLSVNEDLYTLTRNRSIVSVLIAVGCEKTSCMF